MKNPVKSRNFDILEHGTDKTPLKLRRTVESLKTRCSVFSVLLLNKIKPHPRRRTVRSSMGAVSFLCMGKTEETDFRGKPSP